MNSQPSRPALTHEDAFHFLVRFLRNPPRSDYQNYGYDLYLPNVIFEYLRGNEGASHWDSVRPRMEELSPMFYAAAWELCRRGILRPGVRVWGKQVTDDGSGGSGFSITPFGHTWLRESNRDDYVPTEPGRFAQMLSGFVGRFGPAFQARAQEAVRCYGAHCYLACCAMCGAAAETILLTLARGVKPEGDVLKAYRTSGGRGKLEAWIAGQAPARVKAEFAAFIGLLDYWRDDAAHGLPSSIADQEAFTSLALLLRFAQWADERLGTAPPGAASTP
jgi:hypothetical protein